MTFDEQVETVLGWFKKAPEKTQEDFRKTSKENLPLFHHSLGMNIRNELKLWEVPWKAEIVDGVDCSPDHPDAISMRIIEAVWEKVQEK